MRFKRALIVTVGTGTRADVNIVGPLVKTVKDSRPDFLSLTATSASLSNAEKILSELHWDTDNAEIVELEKLDNVVSVFRDLNKVFRSLYDRGFGPEEIQVDFTSGTKAMSAGAVCSAIYNRCLSLRYITGERRNGVVVDGTEEFITMEPSVIHALHDLRIAQEMIRRLRFEAAKEIINGLNVKSLDPDDRDRAKGLRLAAGAYRDWDVFDHHKALRSLERLAWTELRLEEFRPTDEGWSLLRSLSDRNSEDRDGMTLADLYNNAIRRGMEGKYDDAVARLYRCAELLAQSILSREYGIDSSDVDLSKTPAVTADRLKEHRNPEGVVKIGLVMDYELLAALEHSVGRRFMEDAGLQSRLTMRNTSILAHGTTPVSQSLFNRLHSDVFRLIESEMPDFQGRAAAAQFPWLNEGK